MPAITMNKATINLKDGGTNVLEVTVGEGNLTWSEKLNREYMKNRGRLDIVRNGDEEPMDVKLEFRWEFLQASTGGTPTVEDVVKNRGEASSWVTTGDACDPFCVDVEVIHDPTVDAPATCSTAEEIETILLPQFRYETLEHDLRGAQVSVSGRCNATEPTITRTAAS